MILCKSCDAEVQPGQAFCVNCGNRLEGNTYQASTRGVPAAPPPPRPTSYAPPPVAPRPPIAPGYDPGGNQALSSAQNSTLAVISLVSGVVSWIFLPFLAAIAAVITGHMARREIRESGGRLSGEGMAMAGLILGYVNLAIFVLFCGAVFVIGILATLGSQVPS